MADEPDDVVEYWSPRPRPAWHILGVGVLGAAIVLAVHYGPLRAGIEARLTSASEQALGAAGLEGVAVSFSGRDARVSGDPAALDGAVDVVETVRGVRVARVTDGSPAPTATPTTTATETATQLATATATATVTVAPDLATQLGELAPITFEEESATLSDEALDVVAEAADLIAGSAAQTRFVVAAHTDSVGSVSQNVVISQLRADAVVAALIEAGVEPGRLDAVGYGERRPAVLPEVTAADREANRRVEILPLP